MDALLLHRIHFAFTITYHCVNDCPHRDAGKLPGVSNCIFGSRCGSARSTGHDSILPQRADLKAFACSCAYLTVMLVGAAIRLYPRLLPSTAGPRYDITIEKALSGPHTLRVGLAWWAFGMCLAFTYFVIVYRMSRGKVSLEGGGYGH
jgi:cytochrome bd-type quinol oxidase subunit 2